MKNSYDYPEMYKELGVDNDKLGCIMLDVDGSKIPGFDPTTQDVLYYSPDPKKFWVKGFVAGDNPHVTLLGGLMEQGLKWKKYVDKVLEGWTCPTITLKDVGYFDSKEPCYCIVAHVEVSPELIEGRERLQLLPHIDSFPGGYKPHVTLAYIKKDDKIRDFVISLYNKRLQGMSLKTLGINYGGNGE